MRQKQSPQVFQPCKEAPVATSSEAWRGSSPSNRSSFFSGLSLAARQPQARVMRLHCAAVGPAATLRSILCQTARQPCRHVVWQREPSLLPPTPAKNNIHLSARYSVGMRGRAFSVCSLLFHKLMASSNTSVDFKFVGSPLSRCDATGRIFHPAERGSARREQPTPRLSLIHI